MFVIVESGSTKADWVFVENAETQHFYKTNGINPSTQLVFPDMEEFPEIIDKLNHVSALYFYGAGADDPNSTVRIFDWLQKYGFNGDVQVHSDTLAAARACCDTNHGIVGILGTGSNSCVYDGTAIVKAIPSLGYVFSDEGGGVHMGKEIIKEYFYGTMPQNERTTFKKNYNISKAIIIENVYRQPAGNRYIASFASFLTMIDGPWKDEFIKKIFREFVEIRILKYPEYTTYPICFVGSIAYFHRKYLEKVLEEFGLRTDKVVHQPIYKLIEYHIKRNNK